MAPRSPLQAPLPRLDKNPLVDQKNSSRCHQKPSKPGKSQLTPQPSLQCSSRQPWSGLGRGARKGRVGWWGRGVKKPGKRRGEGPPPIGYIAISQGHPGTQALSLCLFGAFGVAFFLSCFPDSRFLSRFFLCLQIVSFCVFRIWLISSTSSGMNYLTLNLKPLNPKPQGDCHSNELHQGAETLNP